MVCLSEARGSGLERYVTPTPSNIGQPQLEHKIKSCNGKSYDVACLEENGSKVWGIHDSHSHCKGHLANGCGFDADKRPCFHLASQAVFYCSVAGDYLESSDEHAVEILESGDFLISSFKYKPREVGHEGVYQCVATNPLGTLVSREVTLDRAGE